MAKVSNISAAVLVANEQCLEICIIVKAARARGHVRLERI